MSSRPKRTPTITLQENQYVREVLHAPEPAPPVPARFFYTSPLAIDDPLSPLPPPVTGSSAPHREPPRPFSVYDNLQLEQEWLDLRKKLLKHSEEQGSEKQQQQQDRSRPGSSKKNALELSAQDARRRGYTIPEGREIINKRGQSSRPSGSYSWDDRTKDDDKDFRTQPTLSGSLRTLDPADLEVVLDHGATTGTPFVRAPSRRSVPRPLIQPHADSYNWADDDALAMPSPRSSKRDSKVEPKPSGPSAKVPVGVSRLHEVVMPGLQMEPIYWSPLNDAAPVIRGTWFYTDTMLPVEPEVANLLEAGYGSLQPWTQTWRDELDCSVEVGAVGEMKIVHSLWPEKQPKPSKRNSESRPSTSRGEMVVQTATEDEPSPEKEREEIVEHARDMIDISSGPEGPDNKASGTATYGRDGRKRLYLDAKVIYSDEKNAYLLRPSLQPSDYYGRRPLANYIRKGRKIGIQVTRGFDQQIWDKLHPVQKTAASEKAREGVSTSHGGAPPKRRAQMDASLAHSERPVVTDLVLVIHGIGQKLSERIESFHFTHAINAFRREMNVELGTDSVKSNLRDDMGGIMVLPVNWRLSLSFEDGGYRDRDEEEDPASNQYTLKDITPDALPSVRNIISDVMLDIPYYLSMEHHTKMIAACIREANRIYRLWCANNPGFSHWGRVHIIAHSLGSVMACDVLSHQPTYVDRAWADPKTAEEDLPTDHFVFDTTNLFLCGSPAGFFLLLKKASLLPRHDRQKPGGQFPYSPGVAGDADTYGCLAVDNVYNVVNPYDPVAYRLNATVDANYAQSLRTAFVPSSNTSWLSFGNPFRRSADSTAAFRASMPRMPSNVELETHNFTREEIAEERAYALNDNGQIDYFMKYGGGPLEIQYLTMLGAHSSYWISRDFVRLIVTEVGRPFGKDGTTISMRAVKRKIER
ncbi:ddhd domain-containing protein [Diplodia corticola]|uniref:Ddhd domain-containing protein n=1 Tax=Diplodia corticola TaxID=236234 RepID=A0A1J9SD11_9PEZI|nr:ddhd domain-containing protein [Diplodia corticola]OJD37740.1 ddhd domain-containing protein [Diplodia corticola]